MICFRVKTQTCNCILEPLVLVPSVAMSRIPIQHVTIFFQQQWHLHWKCGMTDCGNLPCSKPKGQQKMRILSSDALWVCWHWQWQVSNDTRNRSHQWRRCWTWPTCPGKNCIQSGMVYTFQCHWAEWFKIRMPNLTKPPSNLHSSQPYSEQGCYAQLLASGFTFLHPFNTTTELFSVKGINVWEPAGGILDVIAFLCCPWLSNWPRKASSWMLWKLSV